MAAASETTKKRLALAIIDYLNTSVKDGSISSEEAESIEIATNCIGEAFKVDASDDAALKDAVGGQSLLSIYNVYEKLKGKSTPSTQGASSAGEAPPATPATASGSIDPKTKEDADKLKAQGNAAMQKRDYTSAIDLYTQALSLNPLNPIYLSNRAAAYSGALRHDEAKSDAEMAVAADPSFAKAWSRLGLAKFALGDAKGSMEAYQKGIEAEGNGGSEAMRKGFETAKRKVEEEGGDSEEELESSRDPMAGMGGGAGGMPDLSSLAGMFGGGGGAGGGGMPDMASLMNNPMMRQMAQNLMSNPEAMSGLLNNPKIAEMASQFGGGAGGAGRGAGGGGGGMPDLASLMQDPSIRDM
jgi:small glutamine-rich tetratricopeptide repeat-containing protein alpha